MNSPRKLHITPNMKTRWQKIYSFFGFWTYEFRTSMNHQRRYTVLYWLNPLTKRKIDIIEWEIKK